MIADGRARVCKDGKESRQMQTGESFGEIALLRQIPRTATVVAMSRLQARTLTREEFLAAVTGNAASAEGADEVVSTRLQAGWRAATRVPGLATPTQQVTLRIYSHVPREHTLGGRCFAQAVKASVSKPLANRASKDEALSVCAGESGQGGVEPPTFRFSGASAASLHVAECGPMSDLAAETIARCPLMWPDICRRWLPVWLPNLVSAANVRPSGQTDRFRRHSEPRVPLRGPGGGVTASAWQGSEHG